MRVRRRRNRDHVIPIILCVFWMLALVGLILTRETEPDRETEAQTAIIAEKMVAAQLADEPEKIEKAHAEPVYFLTEKERGLIAATCFYEARGEGINGMAAVATVVLNRLQDGRFGATVADVCTQDQFHGLYRSGTLAVSEEAYQAVQMVFDDGQTGAVNGALYFCTAATDPDDIKQGLTETAQIGRHIFYTDYPEE